jgi:hypothetical protein
MAGKVTRVAVTYTVDTPGGPRHTFHGLAHMRRHVRPERLSELLDDLTVICEDLLAARESSPASGPATILTTDTVLELRGLMQDDQARRPRS